MKEIVAVNILDMGDLEAINERASSYPCSFYRSLGHQWLAYGEDTNGLICQVGSEWDKSEKPHHRCACGAVKRG